MIKFLKSFFGSKSVTPAEPVAPYKVEAPEAKVDAVNAQPIAEKKPATERTFVKRDASETKAKVAKIKAPAKPKKPAAKKAAK